MSGQPALKITATRMQIPDGQIPHAGKTLDAAEASALKTFLRLVQDDDCKRLTEDHQQAHLLFAALGKLREALDEGDRNPPITSGLLSLINPDDVKPEVDRCEAAREAWAWQPEIGDESITAHHREAERLRSLYAETTDRLFFKLESLIYPYGRPSDKAGQE